MQVSKKAAGGFFYHIALVDEADDAHFSVASGTNKRVSFVNFSDEVRSAFLLLWMTAGIDLANLSFLFGLLFFSYPPRYVRVYGCPNLVRIFCDKI